MKTAIFDFCCGFITGALLLTFCAFILITTPLWVWLFLFSAIGAGIAVCRVIFHFSKVDFS